MNRKRFTATAILLLAALAAACGGKGGAKPSTDAQVNLSAMDQLKGLSTGLQAQLDALMAPIDEVDKMVDYLGDMPSRLGVDARSLLAAAKATAETGRITLSADLTANAAIAAEIQNVLTRLTWIVNGLRAIPSNTQQLAARAAEAVVKVPALGVQVTTEANFQIANPFAKPEVKARAQADIQSLAQVQADVQRSIQDVQKKITGLPNLATKALAKLTASFAGKKKGKK